MSIMAKLYKTSGEIIEVFPDNGTDFSLDELQDFVEGYIEIINLGDDNIIVINEEGKFINLPYNEFATKAYNKAVGAKVDNIVGNALICKNSEVK